ncbi:hypothetical protein SUGI_0838390 [Cryptomeria japonica]|nr:hypothetical protein SUGI_0838390 [Cryptomeria japonica]
MEWSRSGNGGRVSAEDTVGGEDSDEEEVFLLDMWREAQMAPGSGSDGLSHALRKGFLFPAMSLPHVVASGVSGANLGALQSKSLGASPLSCSIVEDGAAVVVAGVAAVPDDDMDIWSHDCSGDRSGTIDVCLKLLCAMGFDASLHPTPGSPFVPCVEAPSLAAAPVRALGDSASDVFDSSVNGSRVNGFEGLPGLGTASPAHAMVEEKILVHDSLLVKTTAQFQNSLVGRFCSNRPNIDAVRRWVFRIWKSKGQVEDFSMLNIFFLFSFSSSKDCSRVLRDGP